MPLYDYQCDRCGNTWEVRHGFNDDAPACPSCESEETQRLITQAPTFARGALTPAGTSRRQTKEQLKDKWREETPKLRKQLEQKLGREKVQRTAPTLYSNYD